jgi:hypothetical protein
MDNLLIIVIGFAGVCVIAIVGEVLAKFFDWE